MEWTDVKLSPPIEGSQLGGLRMVDAEIFVTHMDNTVYVYQRDFKSGDFVLIGKVPVKPRGVD